MELKASSDPTEQASGSGEAARLEQGAILDRRFRIEKVLGQGGMGHVVSALHLELDQRVAIKLLLPGKEADKRGTQRLLREARASARIKSEHVVRVLDVVSGRETPPYIVMEYLQGEDLAARLSRGPLSVEETVDVVAQACEAIGEAHQLGIVHRDLKPGNLFLTNKAGRADFATVLDFGISKTEDHAGDSLTQSYALLGSPTYSAPEQLRSSHDVDPTADIWSLGVILYECTSGKRPFTGQTLAQLCTQILQDAPSPLGKWWRDLPAGFESVVMRCLEKEPSQRFQSVAELVAALAEFRPEAAAHCLAYLTSVRAGQSSTARAAARQPPRAAFAATLTDSIEYDTEVSIAPPKPAIRSRATLGLWLLALAVAATGAWLLGRASGTSAPASSSSPSVPMVNLNPPSSPAAVALPVPPAAATPAAAPAPSASEAPTARARPASTVKPTKPKQPRADLPTSSRERDVPWVESR